MPLYVYKCDECDQVTEEFESIHDDAGTECPVCASSTYRRIPCHTHTDMKEFHKPIEMHSIGLAHLDEIEDFKRRNPDIPCSSDINDPLYGVPIAATRKQKLDVLANEGFEERK
jgi:putative FmdB family regulatory protein